MVYGLELFKLFLNPDRQISMLPSKIRCNSTIMNLCLRYLIYIKIAHVPAVLVFFAGPRRQ